MLETVIVVLSEKGRKRRGEREAIGRTNKIMRVHGVLQILLPSPLYDTPLPPTNERTHESYEIPVSLLFFSKPSSFGNTYDVHRCFFLPSLRRSIFFFFFLGVFLRFPSQALGLSVSPPSCSPILSDLSHPILDFLVAQGSAHYQKKNMI